MKTYSISKFDPYDDSHLDREGFKPSKFTRVAAGVPLFGLRKHIRALERMGYERSASIIVEPETAKAVQQELFA